MDKSANKIKALKKQRQEAIDNINKLWLIVTDINIQLKKLYQQETNKRRKNNEEG